MTRLLGDGYEPHVDEVDGQLIYSLPVESSFVTIDFSFALEPKDLAVLVADPYRRVVLEIVAHTILQRSMLTGEAAVTQSDFDKVLGRILHGAPEALARYIDEISRDYHISIDHFVQEAISSRSAQT